MDAPVEVPPEKKRKMGEASTEDAEDLGSTSAMLDLPLCDQQVYQMDLFSCLVCTLKAHWDSSDNHNEEYCEVPQPFSRSLPELTDVTSSHISSARASSSSFSVALVRILRQANHEREVACCRSIYRYESSEGQGMVAILKVDPSESRLSQIGEGGRMNFKILVKIMDASQESGIVVTFDSSNHYARASIPDLNLKHFYVIGTQFLRMAKILFSKCGLAPTKIPPFILDAPAEAQLVRANKLEKEWSWSSLPVLPLLMIMDKLDVFDNKRLTTVCKDWEYAAMQCPKIRYSVGDGVPWILHLKYGIDSTSREFIDCLGSNNRKFTVDMPEFAWCGVIFSRGGWIFLHQSVGIDTQNISFWFLVNPFTRDRIVLPKREGQHLDCKGSFTLRDSDGYPDRIILVSPVRNCEESVFIAYPGDKVWSNYSHTGPTRIFSNVIGDYVYYRHPRMTVLNIASNSVKELPSVPPGCFLTEHKGELIYVEYGKSCFNKHKSYFLAHRYDEASSSWKGLRSSELIGTSWYLFYGNNVIAAKGEGLKVYMLTSNRKCQRSVYVFDLLTGKKETILVPSLTYRPQYWVAIG